MNKRCAQTLSLILIVVVFTQLSFKNVNAQGLEDEVYLNLRYQSVVNVYISTIYYNNTFYLSVGDVFNSLNINQRVDSGRFTLSGNFANQGSYIINFSSLNASFKDKRLNFTVDDFLITEFGFYVHPDLFYDLFEMEFSIDFSNLSVFLTVPYTMPVVAQRERERRRARVLRTQSEIRRDYYPLEYSREANFINGGFLDYNLNANLNDSRANSYVYNGNLGAEILGGDIQGTIFGTYSGESSSFRTSGLRWRYGIPNNSNISTISLGQRNSTGLISAAYTGLRVTNEPFEPRYLYGETSLSGSVFANAEVELFRNNTLIDFVQADPGGEYRFIVPITYGTSNYSIRSYSPTGEQSERNIRLQIPQTYLPKGQIRYNIEAGRLDNPISGSLERGLMARSIVEAGISRNITIGGGAEYFEDFHDELPTFLGRVSARVFNNHLISLEAANNAFYRGSLNALYANNASIDISYTYFNENGELYNPANNRAVLRANIFTPFRIGSFPLFFRWSYSREERGINTINRYRVNLNTRFGRANVRFGFRDSYINNFNFEPSPSSRISMATTYTFSRSRNVSSYLRGLFLGGQINYQPYLNQFENMELQLSRSVMQSGRIQMSYGRNFIGNYNLIRISLTLDFRSFRGNSSIRHNPSGNTYTQSIRGSIGYDSNHNNIIPTNRQQVGRAGLAVRMFVDNNNSGTYDEGDQLIPEGTISVERAGAQRFNKGGINYVSQLQSYRRYNIVVNKASVNNPLLVPIMDRFSIITDPNQFKLIEIPFYTSGIIDGMVYRILDDRREGLGGVRLFLLQVNHPEGVSPFRDELRTFADGSFYAYEIPPGDYELRVDQSQLDFLGVKTDPEVLEFTIRALSEGDFVEGLEINLVPKDPFDLQDEADEDTEVVSDVVQEASDLLKDEFVAITEKDVDTETQDEFTKLIADDIDTTEVALLEIESLDDLLILDPNQERVVSEIEIFTQDTNCRFAIQMAEYGSLSAAFNGADRYESKSGLSFQVYSTGSDDRFKIRTDESDYFGGVLANFNRIMRLYPDEKPAIITKCEPEEHRGPLRYYIQLAALSSSESAENLRQMLSDRYDFESRISATARGLNRVQAGPFKRREDLLRAFRILTSDEIAPGLFIVIDPDSYSNNNLEYKLQAGVFSNQRDAVRYAFEISEALNVDTFVIVNGSAVKVMIKKDYNQWDDIFRDFTELSTYDSSDGVAIHLSERE